MSENEPAAEVIDVDGVPDLSSFEDEAEIFHDTLLDAGVFDLAEGDSAEVGTYTNTFTNVSESVRDDPESGGISIRDRVIECRFHGREGAPSRILVRTWEDGGDVLNRATHLLDEGLGGDPANLDRFGEVLENLDIFLDEDEDE